MKSLAVAASAVALLALPGLASAQEATNIYGTVGYAHVDTDAADLGAIQARLGARFHPNFGVEGEAAFGIEDEDFAGGKVELNHQLGVYGVAFLPLNENVDLLARVGYSTAEIEASAPGVSFSDDDSGWAFGVGGQYFFDGVNGVRVDYTRHEYDDGVDADVWGIAYSRRF
jgi:outer membrane immunogenic protein